ncbi:MAG TPA: hypothetical protein VNM22_04930 [Candidatus Limnocylindrales bacterium]|jgi:hypothetical protein|nr:hypothetical protein [Candidatus Limnocylindrales bacterium]
MSVKKDRKSTEGNVRRVTKGFYGSEAYIENRDSGRSDILVVEYWKDIDAPPTGSEELELNQGVTIPDFDMIVCSCGYRSGPSVHGVIWNDSPRAELWIFREGHGPREYIDFLPPPDANGAFSFAFDVGPGEVYRFIAVSPLQEGQT